jgi:putative sporulation protein YyaC
MHCLAGVKRLNNGCRRQDMMSKNASRQEYVNVNSASAFRTFSDTLHALLYEGLQNGYGSIVFVCIGTDRSTGDSLGPLVGYKIAGMKHRNVFVHGDLDNPVHAKNLDSVMKEIHARYRKPFIVAIDACLGKMDHVGYVTLGEGAIKPGSGVNKDLAPVGDIHITGIVNFGGFMDFLVLQNTRLCLVMKMADLIAMGIKYVVWKFNSNPENQQLLFDANA